MRYTGKRFKGHQAWPAVLHMRTQYTVSTVHWSSCSFLPALPPPPRPPWFLDVDLKAPVCMSNLLILAGATGSVMTTGGAAGGAQAGRTTAAVAAEAEAAMTVAEATGTATGAATTEAEAAAVGTVAVVAATATR